MAVAQNNGRTTQVGGVTGSGFLPGQSGNPGGRPKGLSRRVRELVGDDGESIAQFMITVMTDANARTADRLEAAKWLADRAFGKSIQALDVEVRPYPAIDVTQLSDDDLEALIAIFEQYRSDVRELAATGEIEIGSSAVTVGGA